MTDPTALTVQPSPAGVLVEDRLRNLSVLAVEQPLQITCPFCKQRWTINTQEWMNRFADHLRLAHASLHHAADQENDRLRAERDGLKQQVERLSAPVIPNSEQLENFRSSYFANGRDWKENTLRILSRWEERDRQAIIASRTAPAPQPTTPPEEH